MKNRVKKQNSLMSLDSYPQSKSNLSVNKVDAIDSTSQNQSKDDYLMNKKNPGRILLNQRMCYVTKQMLGIDGVDITNPEHFHILISILKKLPKQRFDEELEFVDLAFENVKFFSDIKKQMQYENYLDLFRELTIEEFKSGQRIFSHGDIGRKFYIIIKGSVYILLKKQAIYPDILQQSHHKIEQNLIIETEIIKNQIIELTDDMTDQEKELKVLDIVEGFFIGRTLTCGDSFGEIALKTAGPRTATVLCKDNTIVGVLSKEAYNKFLSRLNQDEMEETLKIFHGMDLFSHWNNNELCSFLMNIEKKITKKHSLIYEENDEASHIYFIKQGEVELSFLSSNLDDTSELSSGIELDNFFKNRRKKKRIRLGIIGSGQFFGEYEIINNLKNREFRARCASQDCVYYSMHKDKFFNTLKDSKTLNILIDHSKRKEAWHKNVVNSFNKFKLNLAFNHIQPQIQAKLPTSIYPIDFDGLTPEPSNEKNVNAKTIGRKSKENILHHITNRKVYTKNPTSPSSFTSLVFDPVGINSQNENNKMNFIDQGQNQVTLKGKFASFLSARALTQLVEKKFEDKNKDSEFFLENINTKRGASSDRSALGIQTPHQVAINKSMTKTPRISNTKSNTSPNIEPLKSLQSPRQKKDIAETQKYSESEIIKLYKKLGIDKIADLLISSSRKSNYITDIPQSPIDNGTLYLTTFGNSPTNHFSGKTRIQGLPIISNKNHRYVKQSSRAQNIQNDINTEQLQTKKLLFKNQQNLSLLIIIIIIFL